MKRLATHVLILIVATQLYAPALAQPAMIIDGWTSVFDSWNPNGFMEIPMGPHKNDQKPVRFVEGDIQTTVFQIQDKQSTSSLLSTVWDHMATIGFTRIFQCETRRCGGFQFRNEIEVVEPPHMFVNLGDFQFISASRTTENGRDHATVLTSRSLSTGFVQIIFVYARQDTSVTVPSLAAPPISGIGTPNFERGLMSKGYVILSEVAFKSGEETPQDGQLPVFQDIARFLSSYPGYSIILVGHTDTAGSEDLNTALSLARAQAVLDILVNDYEVDPNQVSAHGNSFFAPRSSNLTETGRRQNRRVEVVLVPNQNGQ